MTKELASILKQRLSGLPFLDLTAGLVQTVEYKDPTDEAKGIVTKRMPVSTDVNLAQDQECKANNEWDLVPDSSRRGILYFEDNGTTYIKGDGRGANYRSTLTLVCWLNKELLVGDAYAQVGAQVITAILQKLTWQNPVNGGVFTRLKVDPVSIAPMDKGVFSKYTYDETVSQYLRPPFEFFAIQLRATYYVPSTCVPELTGLLTTNPCLPYIPLTLTIASTNIQPFGYPLGVFAGNDTNDYLGIADTPQEYASLWNASLFATQSGYIEPDTEAWKFKFYPKPDYDTNSSFVLEGYLYTLNAFQMDTANAFADSVPAPHGGIIDWGDHTFNVADGTNPANTSIRLYQNHLTRPLAVGTSGFNGGQFITLSNRTYTYRKAYSNAAPRTISVLHQGTKDMIFQMDNDAQFPATYANDVSRLRGYLPVKTRVFEFSNTKQPSFNTFAGIQNMNAVRANVWRLAFRTGDGVSNPQGLDPNTLYDLPNLKCLDMFTYHWGAGGTQWLPILLKQQLGTTNIPAKFPQLNAIGFRGDQYSFDLNLAIPNLRCAAFGTYYGWVAGCQLPAGAADQILEQVDSVKNDVGGTIRIHPATPLGAIGLTAKASLLAKGMTILVQ